MSDTDHPDAPAPADTPQEAPVAEAAALSSAEQTALQMADQIAWISPSHRASPGDALARIRIICDMCGADLHRAMLLVMATHQAVPKEILAAAVKQFRRDLDAHSREDVAGLFTALWNGGQQGFQSVLRTRKNSDRKAGGLSWVKDD